MSARRPDIEGISQVKYSLRGFRLLTLRRDALLDPLHNHQILSDDAIANDVVGGNGPMGTVSNRALNSLVVTSRRSMALGKGQPNTESNQQGACAPILNSCPSRTVGDPSSKGAPCERDCQIGWNVCDLKQ